MYNKDKKENNQSTWLTKASFLGGNLIQSDFPNLKLMWKNVVHFGGFFPAFSEDFSLTFSEV